MSMRRDAISAVRQRGGQTAISDSGISLYCPRKFSGRKCMRVLRAWLVASVIALVAGPMFGATASHAQAWPTRPVKFILTLGAGSGSDIAGRLLADRLTKKWGQ